MTQTTARPRSDLQERQIILRLLQGLNLLDTDHTLVEVRRLVDETTADYWLQRMRAVPISPRDPGWHAWSDARRASLRTSMRALATSTPTPPPTDPAYGDWIPRITK